MKKRTRNLLIAAWISIAVIFGIIGFWESAPGSVWGAFYRTIQLFTLNTDASFVINNIWIRIASTMAVITTTTVILMLIRTIWESLSLFIWNKKKEAVAIHTDSPEDMEPLCKDLGQSARISDNKLAFRAPKNLFYYKDSESLLKILKQHMNDIKPDDSHHVYLCCSEWDAITSDSRGITILSPEQNCARLYWREYPVAFPGEVILIIGFGRYAQALLEQALYVNVLSVRKTADYHVFAMNDSEVQQISLFLSLHQELNQMISLEKASFDSDSLLFYSDSIYNHKDLIQNSRLILSMDDDAKNIETAGRLSRYFNIKGSLYMRTFIRETCDYFGEFKDRIIAFGMVDEILSPDVLFRDKLEKQARLMDASYLLKNQRDNLPDDCKDKDAAQLIETEYFKAHWNGYSSFVRMSNFAQADHIPYKIFLLLGDDWQDIPKKDLAKRIAKTWGDLTEEHREELAEIEHIRWCRYYYMNNWVYGEDKDQNNKRHLDLVPYDKLDDAVKQMDRDTYTELAEYVSF